MTFDQILSTVAVVLAVGAFIITPLAGMTIPRGEQRRRPR